MSKEREKLDQALRDWKKDITKRCDEHLRKYPEHQPLKPRKSAATPKFVLPNTIVQVLESSVAKGTWHVWKNDRLEGSFTGALAQLQATRLATKLLDGGSNKNRLERDVPSSGVPDMCVFCGGRFLHRLDCPDIKKEGPEFQEPDSQDV